MQLKIYDDIISAEEQEVRLWWGERPGVCIEDIDKFIADIPTEDGNIDIYLHCRGGSVTEGWAMVDKLRSTGKKITATIDGLCASMATVIYLAASERRAQPHATLHIHKPYIPPYTLADKYNEEELKALANSLALDTQRILDWYVERTGADRETLAAIMDEDRDMGVEEAMSLGFVHSVVVPISASVGKGRQAWLNKDKTNTNDMAKTNKVGVINALASLLGVKVNAIDEGAVNYVLTTADGSELTIDKPEGEDPAVGDAASPDGEFVLEDGRTIVVVEGVITEIREAEPEADPEPKPEENEELKAENEELKAKVAELEAKLAEADAEKASAEDKAIIEKVNKCGGAEWLNEVAKSDYTPAGRKTASPQAQGAMSKTAQRVAALRGEKKDKE